MAGTCGGPSRLAATWQLVSAWPPPSMNCCLRRCCSLGGEGEMGRHHGDGRATVLVRTFKGPVGTRGPG